MIELHDTTVVNYPYRTAEVVGRFFYQRYESDSDLDKLHHDLAEAADVHLDNHECYSLRNASGNYLYVQFSNWTCYIGSGLVEGDW